MVDTNIPGIYSLACDSWSTFCFRRIPVWSLELVMGCWCCYKIGDNNSIGIGNDCISVLILGIRASTLGTAATMGTIATLRTFLLAFHGEVNKEEESLLLLGWTKKGVWQWWFHCFIQPLKRVEANAKALWHKWPWR